MFYWLVLKRVGKCEFWVAANTAERWLQPPSQPHEMQGSQANRQQNQQFCILPQNQQCFTVEAFAADRKTTHPFSAHCHRVFQLRCMGLQRLRRGMVIVIRMGIGVHNTSHFHPFPTLMNDAVCMSHTFPSLCASFKICICVSCMCPGRSHSDTCCKVAVFACFEGPKPRFLWLICIFARAKSPRAPFATGLGPPCSRIRMDRWSGPVLCEAPTCKHPYISHSYLRTPWVTPWVTSWSPWSPWCWGCPSIFGPAVHRAAPAAAVAPATQGSGPCGSTASRGNGNSGGWDLGCLACGCLTRGAHVVGQDASGMWSPALWRRGTHCIVLEGHWDGHGIGAGFGVWMFKASGFFPEGRPERISFAECGAWTCRGALLENGAVVSGARPQSPWMEWGRVCLCVGQSLRGGLGFGDFNGRCFGNAGVLDQSKSSRSSVFPQTLWPHLGVFR